MSAIVLVSKPGITNASTLSIPKDWNSVWFKNLVSNLLKGADVRNATSPTGTIKIGGNISSPYGTLDLNTANLVLTGELSILGILAVDNAAGTQNVFVVNPGSTPEIAGRGPTAGGLVDMTPDTGSFTGTFTGFSTTVTGTVVWSKNGNQITMTVPAFSGTSNTTSLSMTGIPAEIQPTRTQNYALPPQNSLENSGAAVTSCGMHIDAGSTITFYINGNSTGWTASGTKGNFAPFSFTYLLN